MTSTVSLLAEIIAPAGWRTVDFLSDLHLQAEEPVTFDAWQRYLQQTPADAVFILGDLFEVWIGDDQLDPLPGNGSSASFEARCVQVLRDVAQRKALYLMHGNRDFLLGSSFMAQCHGRLMQDPCNLHFAGQRWLLSHGDALCLDDVPYQQFRQQVRSARWQHDFLARPLQERRALARQMRQQSEAAQRRATTWADADLALSRQWLQTAGAHTLIHGHTHRPADHDISLDGTPLRRVVLSDWDTAATPPRAQVVRLTSAGLQRIDLIPATR